MAISIFNIKCPLCENNININEPNISFPPYVSNKLDPLYIINDSIVHEKCYKNFEFYELAETIITIYKNSIKNGYKCIFCGEKILNPIDLISFGYLVYNTNDPLYNYNFSNMHIECFKRYDRNLDLVFCLEKLNLSGCWGGKSLSNLIGRLNEIIYTI